MNVCNLNKSQMESFLEYCFSIRSIREKFEYNFYFKNSYRNFLIPYLKEYNSLSDIPDDVILNIAYKMVLENDFFDFTETLNKFYNEIFLRNINDKKRDLINNGLDDDMALALSLKTNVNEKFLHTYYEIENIDLDKQKRLEQNYNLYFCVKKVVKEEFFDFKSFSENKISNFNETIKEINEKLELLNNKIQEIETKKDDKNSDTNSISLSDLEKKFYSKEEIDSMTNFNSFYLDDKISDKLDDYNSIINKRFEDKIEDLKKKINDNNESIENLSTFINGHQSVSNDENNNFLINYIKNDEYSCMDEDLDISIGDVIEESVNGAKFDALEQYLIEIIYSNKPIICTKDNSTFFATLLSSILTGTNYYEVTLETTSSDVKLIEEIEKFQCIEGNKVILIKNKINVSDHQYLLEYIKTQPFNYKFIFEVLNDKEIRYMPLEILKDFNFYLGEIEFKTPGYNYAYNFKNENRKPLKNGDFDNELMNFGITSPENLLINVKYYGLLSFSILPFLKIYENVSYDELLNRISNEKYKSICKEVLNGISDI